MLLQKHYKNTNITIELLTVISTLFQSVFIYYNSRIQFTLSNSLSKTIYYIIIIIYMSFQRYSDLIYSMYIISVSFQINSNSVIYSLVPSFWYLVYSCIRQLKPTVLIIVYNQKHQEIHIQYSEISARITTLIFQICSCIYKAK